MFPNEVIPRLAARQLERCCWATHELHRQCLLANWSPCVQGDVRTQTDFKGVFTAASMKVRSALLLILHEASHTFPHLHPDTPPAVACIQLSTVEPTSAIENS